MDHDHLPDALVQKRAGGIFHIFEVDGAVCFAEGYAQALLGLDLVDNEVVGIFEARQHYLLIAVALFGNDVHAGLVALLAKAVQGAGGCHAVFGILFVQAVQQQQVAQVEDSGGALAVQHLLYGELGIGAAAVEEGAGTAALGFGHHIGIGSGLAGEGLDVGAVNAQAVAGIQAHPAVLVVAYAASSIQRKTAFEACQVGQDIVGTAAQTLVLPHYVGEVSLLGINSDKFDRVHDPVADSDDAFTFHTQLSFNQLVNRF